MSSSCDRAVFDTVSVDGWAAVFPFQCDAAVSLIHSFEVSGGIQTWDTQKTITASLTHCFEFIFMRNSQQAIHVVCKPSYPWWNSQRWAGWSRLPSLNWETICIQCLVSGLPGCTACLWPGDRRLDGLTGLCSARTIPWTRPPQSRAWTRRSLQTGLSHRLHQSAPENRFLQQEGWCMFMMRIIFS